MICFLKTKQFLKMKAKLPRPRN